MPVEFLTEAENFKDYEGVYPDNMPAVLAFSGMLTQWRVGNNGPFGLDYNVLPIVMGFHKIASDDIDFFHCIRVMEDAALGEFRSKQ